MPPQLPASGQPAVTPGWAAITMVGLGIFAVILVKEAYDVGHAQGWF